LLPLIFLFLVAGISTKVTALEPEQGYARAGDLTEVVVTATRYEEEVRDVPANVTVINTNEIERSTARNIPDLLRTQGGILVNDINGSRKNYTVDLRGFGETAGSNTLVLVDGRRVNQADLSGTDWTQIPLDRVERIEIIRGGNGAVLYGDNATGGVINIITKEADKRKAGIEGTYGSYNAYGVSGFYQNTAGPTSLSLNGSYSKTDGYRDNSDSKTYDLGSTINYYQNQAVRWFISGGYHNNETGLPGPIKQSDFGSGVSRTDTLTPDNFSEIKDYYIKIGPEIQFTTDGVFKMDVSYRKRKSLFSYSYTYQDFMTGHPINGNFTGDTGITTWSTSPQFIFNKKMGETKHTLTVGADYERSAEDISNDTTDIDTVDNMTYGSSAKYDLSRKNYGLYIYEEVKTGKAFTVSGGYRYDNVEFEFDPSDPDKVSADESAYMLGVNYGMGEKSYGYISYNRSFRYPLLDEFFVFSANTVNTSLSPQRSDSYEVGARVYLGDSSYVHLNYFRLDTKDEIFYNLGTYSNENLDGKTRRQGIEVALLFDIARWLSLNGSYTYTDPEIRSGQFKGNDIPNVPYHKASLSADLSLWRQFSAVFSGIYVGERRFISDFDNSFGGQKGYIVVNTKFKYDLAGMIAFLDINNLFNYGYSEYGVLGGFPTEKAYYPSPGRNFLLGLSIEL